MNEWIENGSSNWCAGNSKVATEHDPVEVRVPSADVPDKKELALLLEKVASWTRDVGSIYLHCVEAL